MTAFDVLSADLRALDDHEADVLVLPVFEDERPLRDLAGQVDWRLCGALSRWLQDGFATGRSGERVLYPTHGRLTHAQVLLLGLGPSNRHRSDRARDAAADASRAVRDLGARTMTTALFGLERLPTPLERSLPELLAVLAASGLERVALAVPAPSHPIVQAALAERRR